MSNPAISIDSETMRAVVAKGILDAIGPEQRDLMISAAVDHLLVEPEVKGQYGRPEKIDSPLTAAFKQAVQQMAREVVNQMLSEDHIRSSIDSSIRTAVTGILVSEGGWLYSTVGSAVGDRVEEIMKGKV